MMATLDLVTVEASRRPLSDAALAFREALRGDGVPGSGGGGVSVARKA